MPYRILESLGVTSGATLYRGKALVNDAPVVLKRAAPGQEARLRREATLLHSLRVPGVPRPLALLDDSAGLTLVLASIPGMVFEHALAERRFDLSVSLCLACQATRIVADLHAAGLTHHEVRPAHFLYDPASPCLSLIDLSLASTDTEPAPQDSAIIDWAYLSPEQTGRMHRPVDYRTDFYALGVLLYRLLTGQLPIQGRDPLEFLHGHLARLPIPPITLVPTLPPVLSDLVLRLLAKLPEERYQSASGVLADLEYCRDQWDLTGRITPFTLGRQDVPDRFHIAHKLYGRDDELRQLLAAFDHVTTAASPTLVTITGASGIGKSSLVQALRQPILQRQGYVIGGKFDQYQRDIPYATLTQACQELVKQLLAESDARVAAWRQLILEAVGGQGRLLIDALPQVELIIGPQPAVPPLPLPQAQQRFQQVFRRFLAVFASAEHPLVLFLDDVQWIDAASLNLIEHVLNHPETRYLLVIEAYREHEVGAAHPLQASLARLRHGAVRVHEIALAPLPTAALTQLVAETVHATSAACAPLTALIDARTEGNPFFFIQFLDALHHDGLVRHDPQERAWIWDLAQIQARDFADNAVDLVVQRLHLLAPPVQDLLQWAACLGNTCEVHRLALLTDVPLTEVEQSLAAAASASLVARMEGQVKFLHDRIQQAAYSLLPEAACAARHAHLARRLIARLAPEEVEATLYDIASQWNRGAACLVSWPERTDGASWNLRAGRKAMAASAYGTASALLAAGLTLLGEDGWEREHNLTFALTLERARCEFVGSRFEETGHLLAVALAHATSPIEYADASCVKVQLHLAKLENLAAVEQALASLRLFGIELPLHPEWEQVQQAYTEINQLMAGRSIESLLDLPVMTDPDIEATTRVLSFVNYSAFYIDIRLYALTKLLLMKWILQYGISESSITAYTFGTMLGPLFHRYADGFRLAKVGCELVEQKGFLASKARIHIGAQFAALWVQPIEVAIDHARIGFDAGVESGDYNIACLLRYHLIVARLLRGDPLDEVRQEAEDAHTFVYRAGHRGVADIIGSQQRFIAHLQGQTPPAPDEEAAFEAHLLQGQASIMVFRYWMDKLQARFLLGDYALALATIQAAKPLTDASISTIHYMYYLYYTALTVAALYDTGTPEQQNEWQELLTAYEQQLREWAENYPPTFRDKHALVQAEYARIHGDDSSAMRLYQVAIDAAAAHCFPHHEGIAHEAAARFYFARGATNAAQHHLQAARDSFARWGAHAKVRQLEAHPHWRAPVVSPPASVQDSAAHLDVLSVTQASQAISGRLVLEELIETLLRIAMESAGAQTGCLWLARGEEWLLAANARTDQHAIMVQQYLIQPAPELPAPASVINYVRRTGEAVLLPDAIQSNPFSSDPYLLACQPRSIWCLPIRRQGGLLGILYLEHGEVPQVFTPARQAVVDLLAAQAAISLENALLVADLRRAHEELEERVRERTTELARSNADLEQFASVASHDLQEPLRTIASYLQLLEQRYHGRLDTEADEFIEFALDGAQRMQGLIKDLLAYARLGTPATAGQVVDCQAVMAAVFRALQLTIADSGAQITCTALPRVLGNETRVMQLFQNLIANALKFRSEQAPRIEVRATCEDRYWHFAVQDNGIGIAPEYFERIFGMFQRLHSRHDYPGTGIGLALCKRIVEGHGGRIWVESSSGGSTFHFTLPCAKDDSCHFPRLS